jgi:hypothetical protein
VRVAKQLRTIAIFLVFQPKSRRRAASRLAATGIYDQTRDRGLAGNAFSKRRDTSLLDTIAKCLNFISLRSRADRVGRSWRSPDKRCTVQWMHRYRPNKSAAKPRLRGRACEPKTCSPIPPSPPRTLGGARLPTKPKELTTQTRAPRADRSFPAEPPPLAPPTAAQLGTNTQPPRLSAQGQEARRLHWGLRHHDSTRASRIPRQYQMSSHDLTVRASGRTCTLSVRLGV